MSDYDLPSDLYTWRDRLADRVHFDRWSGPAAFTVRTAWWLVLRAAEFTVVYLAIIGALFLVALGYLEPRDFQVPTTTFIEFRRSLMFAMVPPALAVTVVMWSVVGLQFPTRGRRP